MSIRAENLAAYANRFSEYTELRLQRNVNSRIALLNGDVVTNSRSVDGGISARVFKDGVWGFASRPETDSEAVNGIIEEATRNAAFLARHGGQAAARLPRARGQGESDFATRRRRRSPAEVIEFLRALDEHIAVTYPELRSRTVSLWDLDMEKRLYNSDASQNYSNTTRSLVIVRLVTSNDQGQPVELGKPFGGRGQFEDVFERPEDLYDDIAMVHRHLMAKREAVPANAGVHDVILDSELAGILAHEAIGHTTEADIVRSGSVAGDHVGQRVASDLITLVDFANRYEGETLPVPVYVDDEGMPARDTVLIENGVLKGFMHNKESAEFFHAEATGNARAYQFFDEPLIRMRNTAILPGPHKLADMIASVEDGYYLMWPSNGQADSTSEFMFGVSLGYEIRNGKVGRAITRYHHLGRCLRHAEKRHDGFGSDELELRRHVRQETDHPGGHGRSGGEMPAASGRRMKSSPREFAERSLDALGRRGFGAAQVRLTTSERHELEAEFGRPSLMRTNHDVTLDLVGIADDKRGSVTLNRLTDEALSDAVDELWEVAAGSRADPANAIAPAQPANTFSRGPDAPDADLMYERLTGLLGHAARQYPTLSVRQATIDFVASTETFLNSNGVDFTARQHRYSAYTMFSAREGDRVSSFNYTGFTRDSLDEPLERCATLDTLMRQATEQVHTQRIPGKFTGELLITPDCLTDFLGFLLQNIGDGPLITGTSLYAGRLGEAVAAQELSLHSCPRSLPAGYFVTGDGFEAEDATIVDRGRLTSYLLGLYGANKTGLARSVTGGGCWVMDAGTADFDSIVSGIDRGMLITRFSGGRPNDKGDFSGIAKNSYYIEGGRVRHPVSETMISGNLATLLQNVQRISAERADFGSRMLPWVQATGIVVS